MQTHYSLAKIPVALCVYLFKVRFDGFMAMVERVEGWARTNGVKPTWRCRRNETKRPSAACTFEIYFPGPSGRIVKPIREPAYKFQTVIWVAKTDDLCLRSFVFIFSHWPRAGVLCTQSQRMCLDGRWNSSGGLTTTFASNRSRARTVFSVPCSLRKHVRLTKTPYLLPFFNTISAGAHF